MKHIKHPQNGHPKIHEIIWETSGIAVTVLACGSYAHPSLVARESMHHHWCSEKWVDQVDLLFLFMSILAASYTITSKTKKNTQIFSFTFISLFVFRSDSFFLLLLILL
jgi:hypothetical protein